MDKIHKYCSELRKAYDLEEINSNKATVIRKKLRRMLLDMEVENDGEPPPAIELFWRVSYYDPISKLRKRKDVDRDWLNLIVSIFCGELQSMLAANSRNAAVYNMYIGDLHRYLSNTVQSSLATTYYRRAVEMNPDFGHSYNQLALGEQSISKAMRFFLLSLIARYPFHSAWGNLLRTLSQDFENPIESIMAQIVSKILYYYSRADLSSIGTRWLEELKLLSDPLSHKDIPLSFHILSLSSRLSLERVSEDAFLFTIPLMCDCFSFLLDKIITTEDEENLVQKRSRRRRISSDDDSDDSDGKSETENFIDKQDLQDEVVVHGSWLLAVSCEWMIYTSKNIQFLRSGKKIPIPAAVENAYSSLTDKVIDKLNLCMKALRVEEGADEEISWLLYGPNVECNERSLRQAAHWALQLSATADSPVEYIQYFRRRGQTGQSGTLLRKMAQLHLEEVKREAQNSSWMPVYIVLDYAVLENHLPLVRPLVNSGRLITIIPSFVLAMLDKRKGTGSSVRAAMRLIEMGQQHDRIRIVTASSYSECCEQLVASASESGDDCFTWSHSLVSLLVNDIEQFHTTTIPSVAIYHIESFCDRWNKGSSSRTR